eukprot:s2762_g9.t1
MTIFLPSLPPQQAQTQQLRPIRRRVRVAMVLPEGIESDRQLDTLRLAEIGLHMADREERGQRVKNLQDLGEKLKDKLQAPRAKSFIQDIVRSLDPETNPTGYRICQDELVRLGGASALIETVGKVNSDLVRSLALEALARMMFGNAKVAEAVLQSYELLPMIRMVFSNGSTPEQLTALQLAQVMAASDVDQSHAYALLQEAKGFLQDNLGFAPMSQAALEVFVSISFSQPVEVISCLGFARIKQLFSEQEDTLQAFVCGLLVSNCLAHLEESEAHELRESLLSGTFLENYVQCLQASIQKCDWPENSNAFHSPRRLAIVAQALAAQGLGRHLLPAVPLLVQAVECDDAVPTLLVTLKILAADPRCLQMLLAEESFRQNLDSMHDSGDPRATELLGYMELVESALAAGQAAKSAQAKENPNAPEVMQLAEIFSSVRALDGKLEAADLEQLCASVPLAPREKVMGSLSLRSDLTLQAFLEHIYGTPTILGWWPSLMEEAASEAVQSGLPLADVCSAFELAAKRGHVEIQDLHDVLLPALGLPTEGVVVEEKFAELHGSAPLPFRKFTKWLADFYIRLTQATNEEG